MWAPEPSARSSQFLPDVAAGPADGSSTFPYWPSAAARRIVFIYQQLFGRVATYSSSSTVQYASLRNLDQLSIGTSCRA